ncbi:MAG: hypothetical protein LBN97_06315, partial [Oscillospiraceae bacterium]|nr:hypothetical protein [Oscillospiraceae bacterium]
MKRFTLLFALVLLFALAACGDSAEPIASAEPTLNTAKAELAAASPSASAAALTPEASPTPDRGVTIETEHFIITNYGEPEETVTALANALEDNFERITTTLKVVILDKTNVRLYPDNDSL